MAQDIPTLHSDPTDQAPPTLRASSGSIKTELSQFLAARAELASIEVKEAAGFAAQKTILAVIISACLFFTWVIILAAATGVLAPMADRLLVEKCDWLPGWAAVLFIFALLHLKVAGICVFFLKKKPNSPLFELSLQEIQKDKQWLKKSN